MKPAPPVTRALCLTGDKPTEPPATGLLAVLEDRKEDDVTDRVPAREHHRQPIDAETQAARRRHSVRQRLDVVRVPLHPADELRLGGETLGLRLRIVDLGK